MYWGYKPGMEIDVSRAIRDKYLFDGNNIIQLTCALIFASMKEVSNVPSEFNRAILVLVTPPTVVNIPPITILLSG